MQMHTKKGVISKLISCYPKGPGPTYRHSIFGETTGDSTNDSNPLIGLLTFMPTSIRQLPFSFLGAMTRHHYGKLHCVESLLREWKVTELANGNY